MKRQSASGLQIAFLTFALLLIAVPLTNWLARLHAWSAEQEALLHKAVPFVLGAAILFGIPAVRRYCLELLGEPLRPQHRAEVAAVAVFKLMLPFAAVGAIALWQWAKGGEPGLAQYVRAWRSDDAELAAAFVPAQVVLVLVIGGILAPVLEEVLFRGMLYRAWERRWGWLASMMATSLVFALYHRSFLASFLSSMVFVCLYRRTGSLWAPIVVHAIGNLSLWYPLLGRHVVPRNAVAPGDISAWGLQLACLLVVLVAIPAYVWMARFQRQPDDLFPPTVANGAVSR